MKHRGTQNELHDINREKSGYAQIRRGSEKSLLVLSRRQFILCMKKALLEQGRVNILNNR